MKPLLSKLPRALTRDEVGCLLGLSLRDTEAFLKERLADLGCHDEDSGKPA